jgi:protein SCO1
MTNSLKHSLALLTVLFLHGLLCSAPAVAQSEEITGLGSKVRVEDKVGEFIPKELLFKDDSGKTVKLESYLKPGKTVVMTLNYSDCPGLCIAQLENLVETLRRMDGQGLGENYEIVTVSIDPREDTDKASRTKAKYTTLLRDTEAEANWHFLVGKQPEITALAKSLGYYYTYDKENNRFNHPAVLYFISAEVWACRLWTSPLSA